MIFLTADRECCYFWRGALFLSAAGGGADLRTWVSIYATSAGGGADLKTRVCIYATSAGGVADIFRDFNRL